MALFKKKGNKTVDLGERYRKQQERISNIKSDMQQRGIVDGNANAKLGSSFNASGNSFGFLDNASSYSQQPGQNSGSSESIETSGMQDEKKRKLAKRLMDITDKLEEVSNQLYHLQQRVEVLEKKTGNN